MLSEDLVGLFVERKISSGFVSYVEVEEHWHWPKEDQRQPGLKLCECANVCVHVLVWIGGWASKCGCG